MTTATTENKRAVIYIRVSSEQQAGADKVSPEQQESDCRDYCHSKGYIVGEIYKDIERYRVGKRMVEPSGTRSDRPQLKAMLADARSGKFDVIIAWREDRLYRSYRPMLDVLDCLDETKIDIELVKEVFDKRIAPIKAWAARMELDARKDRTAMGVGGRFAKGKVWHICVPYGYHADSNAKGEINEDEAQWVRAIWKWKAEGESLGEIRRRLIQANVPQRRVGLLKFRWQQGKIARILNHDVYYTGIHRITWDGKAYEIHFPQLIDAETARLANEARERVKLFPARNIKYNYLAAGITYCLACGTRMGAFTRIGNGHGPSKKPYRYYRCYCNMRGNTLPGCAKKVPVSRLDSDLWEKVKKILNGTEDLEEFIQKRVEVLRKQEKDAQTEVDRIGRELEQIEDQRQWVITQARTKSITEKDMRFQLAILATQEDELRNQQTENSLLIGNKAEKLSNLITQYRTDLRGRLELLDREGDIPEQAQLLFEGRRRLVETIVRKVEVNTDKSIKVTFEFEVQDGDHSTE